MMMVIRDWLQIASAIVKSQMFDIPADFTKIV
jgi:hypothetical protein